MKFIRKLRLSVQFIGLRAVLRTILYARYRDRENAPESTVRLPAPIVPESLVELRFSESAIQLQYENGISLQAEILPGIGFCMTWLPGKLPYTAYLEKNREKQKSENTEGMAMRNSVAEDISRPAYQLLAGDVALQISSNGEAVLTEHGEVLARSLPPALSGNNWDVVFPRASGDKIFGLGQRAGSLELSGRHYTFWNTDPGGSYGRDQDPLYLNIPLFLRVHGGRTCLMFIENTFRGSMDLTNHEQVHARFEGGALRIFWIFGTLPEVYSRYAALTGRAELPPRWSLGFHQCRWGYDSEADLRRILDGFSEHALPLQALHQDIDYMEDHRVFTVDSKRYPKLAGLSADMAMRNIRLVTIVDPGVKIDPNYHVFRSGSSEDAFVKSAAGRNPTRALVWPGWCAFPDFTSVRVRSWWAQQYRPLLELGISGIWHDMNEPAAMAAWGDLTLPETSRHDFDGRPGSHLEAHNIYGLLMNQAGWESLKAFDPGRRPWLLSRSGWAGSQRYAWHWTADVESTWEALRLSLPMLLNLGLSGFPYSGTDIGGFSGNPDAELFTRWFQFASYTPFFRNHAARGTRPREPWVYGEPYTGIIRRTIQGRLELLPYWYTLALQSARNGAPLMRPLFWSNPADDNLLSIDDAFLLGSDLLVAPVFEPGATTRKVHLPAGCWYHWFSGQRFTGNNPITAAISLAQIPVFARAGTIIPTENEGRLDLKIFPDAHGSAQGRVYYDAGDGYGQSGGAAFSAEYDGNLLRVKLLKKGAYTFPWGMVDASVPGSNTGERIIEID